MLMRGRAGPFNGGVADLQDVLLRSGETGRRVKSVERRGRRGERAREEREERNGALVACL
jgi:hypothetical protein